MRSPDIDLLTELQTRGLAERVFQAVEWTQSLAPDFGASLAVDILSSWQVIRQRRFAQSVYPNFEIKAIEVFPTLPENASTFYPELLLHAVAHVFSGTPRHDDGFANWSCDLGLNPNLYCGEPLISYDERSRRRFNPQPVGVCNSCSYTHLRIRPFPKSAKIVHTCGGIIK